MPDQPLTSAVITTGTVARDRVRIFMAPGPKKVGSGSSWVPCSLPARGSGQAGRGVWEGCQRGNLLGWGRQPRRAGVGRSLRQ